MGYPLIRQSMFFVVFPARRDVIDDLGIGRSAHRVIDMQSLDLNSAFILFFFLHFMKCIYNITRFESFEFQFLPFPGTTGPENGLTR